MEHLDEFLTSRIAAGLSSKTVEWYDWLLRKFDEYCELHDLDPGAPEVIEQFFVCLRISDHAPATVSAYYRVLRVFHRWLVKRGYEESSPVDLVERPRVPRRRKRHVTLEEWRLLYDSIEPITWSDYRDQALLIVMFFSGLRVTETVDLRVQDIDLGRNLISVRRGKGGHSRLVPCAPTLAKPYYCYMENRPEYGGLALWLSNDGNGGVRGPLTAEGVRVMLRRRTAAAGLRHINPHALRHGFAMTLLNAGMDLSAISAALGHTSQSVTEQVYASWLTDGLVREYSDALKKLNF